MPHLLSTFSERNRHQTRRRSRASSKKTTTAAAATSAVRAELIGANRSTALGIKVCGPSPVLALCRTLVEAGHDPSTPLEAYRDGTLALRVRSIGEAAGLEGNGEGTGFRPARKPDRAPPIRQNLEAAIRTQRSRALQRKGWACQATRGQPSRIDRNDSN